MIQSSGLTKRYSNRTVVDAVSLHVSKGQIFGLLGPNAAGKTTIMRMLCGIITNDGGEVTINGMGIDKAKTDFGYVAQHFGQYEELSVWENLKFYASMYKVTDEQHLLALLDRYNLTSYKNQNAGSLSGGYKRRLALTCALAHDPQVLFLDEPTAGIDPVTRKLLWDDFYKLSTEGKTLFITTHYMEEAQRCHKLAFLSSGVLVAEGSPETIKEALGEVMAVTAKIPYHPDIHQALHNLDGIILVNQFGNELRIVASPDLKQSLLENTIAAFINKPFKLESTEANLEDIFIALTQSREAGQ